MDVFHCVQNCRQLIQYVTTAQSTTGKKKKGIQSQSESFAVPDGLVIAVHSLARKYLPLLVAQFGPLDDDILSIQQNFLAVPGCSNPNCHHISTVAAAVISPVLMKCSRCQLAMYCCRECQVHDFKNGHKAVCKGNVK